MKKFVIVGMTDSESVNKHLWSLANARTGISPEEWAMHVEIVNLCEGDEWIYENAAKVATPLRDSLKDVTTILLGVEVCRAMWFAEPPLHWDRRGRPWSMVPHPERQVIWYNNEGFKFAVEILFEDLLELAGWKKTEE